MIDLEKITKNKCYIIAEIGLNHNGSLDLAKELIDIAKRTGCDAVKFQKRDVKNLAIKSVLNKLDLRFPSFGKTYKEIRNYLEFNRDQYIYLQSYAKKKNIDFIVTAFDINSLTFLESLKIKTIKIASHSLTNIYLLEKISQKKISSILSTGMSKISEIDTAVKIFKKNRCPLSIMHCVSSYPTPNNECNLNLINFLKQRYELITGYSGHEIGFFPTVIAVSLGAKIIERHITVDNTLEGFDHKISLEPNELSEMVKQIRNINIVKGSEKKIVSNVEKITRKKYHVSMTSNKKLKKGQVLTKSMIVFKNPGTGISPQSSAKYYGKILNQDIENSSLILPKMLD